ncbi:hypothetical protein [Oceanobacter sp. 3_MG-2023]|uniref:hypothetical protein n=1 Tax=Oceanobacter sp. 3_MG-2023 TaxID=3062622 RepID=UPI002735417B|nr:hypothetical protein [Oceanobacter sp. 3_MG-2023]MDP2505397.1 hypothetical protein [Oceanobacter sp. 3_MG-2023]
MIDFGSLNYFDTHEFPAGVSEFCDPYFFAQLDEFRSALGVPVTPSPLAGGWWRHDGSETSRHFVGPADDPIRLSDAGDVVVDCSPMYAMTTAIQCGFTGIGIYYDTQMGGKTRLMLHLDCRPGDLVIWERRGGVYTTLHPRASSAKPAIIGY